MSGSGGKRGLQGQPSGAPPHNLSNVDISEQLDFLHSHSGIPESAFQETGRGSLQSLKADAQEPAQHHIHHILLVRQKVHPDSRRGNINFTSHSSGDKKGKNKQSKPLNRYSAGSDSSYNKKSVKGDRECQEVGRMVVIQDGRESPHYLDDF